MAEEQQNSKPLVQAVTARQWSQLPPTQFISAFTLQQKGGIGTTFAGGTDRFARAKVGSYFATNTAEPTSFYDQVKYTATSFHKPKIPSKDEIPKHRPLWTSEIRKEVPAGATYDLDSTFGSKKTLFKTRGVAFREGYNAYARTCDIQKNIQIFGNNTDADQRGVASYDIDRGLNLTKKRNPCYSQSKSKQFELWNKEVKRAEVIPAPDTYNQETTKSAKPSRFDNIHLGTDVKTTAKDIKLTPGPGHYTHIDDAILSRTFHHATKHGGTQMSSTHSTMKAVQGNMNLKFVKGQSNVNNSCDADLIIQAKRNMNLLRKCTTATGSHCFGAPTGTDIFFDTMTKGFNTKVLVQPPMLVGKAKKPADDLQCVRSHPPGGGYRTQQSRQKHKTIEHLDSQPNNNQNSFILHSSTQDFTGKLSPIPPVDLENCNLALSEENLGAKKSQRLEKQKKGHQQIRMQVMNQNKPPSMRKQGIRKNTTGTIGNISDVSTTVRAPSVQTRRQVLPPYVMSQSHNFADLGDGLINFSPNSKRSLELHMKRPTYTTDQTIFIDSDVPRKTGTMSHSSNYLKSYGVQRGSTGQPRMRKERRFSSRNPTGFGGGFKHSNFI